MSEPVSARALTATRWSTLFGLWLVMLVSLPRYWLGHDDTRLTLLAVLLAAVAVALTGFWRVMDAPQRHRCPRAIGNLIVCLLVGWVLIGLWHWLESSRLDGWAIMLSQGAALGLLLHVVSRIWRRRR